MMIRLTRTVKHARFLDVLRSGHKRIITRLVEVISSEVDDINIFRHVRELVELIRCYVTVTALQ